MLKQHSLIRLLILLNHKNFVLWISGTLWELIVLVGQANEVERDFEESSGRKNQREKTQGVARVSDGQTRSTMIHASAHRVKR